MIHDLVSKSVQNDYRAFEQLVGEFQSYAFALAFRLLCDEDEAHDAVQEAFVRVWDHFDRYDRKRKFTTWLYTIVTNVAIDKLRAIRRYRGVFVSGYEDSTATDIRRQDDLHEIQSNRELADMIRSLTHNLPLKQRLVFTLRDLQDCSVEEVCAITGMSIGSVKTNLHYARERIRKLMARKYDVERFTP